MGEIEIIIASAVTSVLAAFCGWFFGRKKQKIENIDAATETWQKIVDALETRLMKELEKVQCYEQKIEDLTEQVRNLKTEIEELKDSNRKMRLLEKKVLKYEKLLTDNKIDYK
jgi:peptidoglycan hydrolase CwlO-like protein